MEQGRATGMTMFAPDPSGVAWDRRAGCCPYSSFLERRSSLPWSGERRLNEEPRRRERDLSRSRWSPCPRRPFWYWAPRPSCDDETKRRIVLL